MSWKKFNIRNVFNLLKEQLPLLKNKMPFYSVAKGRINGIYMSWADCEAQVKGFPGARYKKFDTIDAAQEFLKSGGSNLVQNPRFSPANLPTINNNKLKRSSSKLTNPADVENESAKRKKNTKTQKPDTKMSEWSDSDDELNTILMKQMDDIEKRIKGCERGVDKIIKQSVKNKKTKLIEQSDLMSKDGFETDDQGYVQVYTDGACSSNGRAGARAGLGVFWGNSHPLNISAPVSGRATNNCGEIQAATQAIKTALKYGVTRLSVNTDSKFLISAVTKWMPGWKKKNWKLKSGEPVKNEIDFKELDSLQHKLDVKWNYVEAHRGIHGNEMADQLAKAGATMYKV